MRRITAALLGAVALLGVATVTASAATAHSAPTAHSTADVVMGGIDDGGLGGLGDVIDDLLGH
ncbi:hypothetical protein ACIRQP_06210 [Streptomyces sp. NPDC102274]|uniref:hypothetical protein n=1 Tax=Streptomyces sp. NPDC102274 TaxID=3366151 RepID=UPI003830F95C